MHKTAPQTRVAIGQSCHRFLPPESAKPCIIAGVIFDDIPGFQHESDGDIVFHALSNAISSISHVPILGGIAKELLNRDGITDSEVFLKEALKTIFNYKIISISISLEAKRPVFEDYFLRMRQNISKVCSVDLDDIGITAIYGDGLTDCSCGDGVNCFVAITLVDIK
jgi:2-C-methyl-D-erythritol 2,4-cyclodiphosphate synthase